MPKEGGILSSIARLIFGAIIVMSSTFIGPGLSLASHKDPVGFLVTLTVSPTAGVDGTQVNLTADICETDSSKKCADHASDLSVVNGLYCDFRRSVEDSPNQFLDRPEYDIKRNVQCTRPDRIPKWQVKQTWTAQFRNNQAGEKEKTIGLQVILRTQNSSIQCPGTGSPACSQDVETFSFGEAGSAIVIVSVSPNNPSPGGSYSVSATLSNFSGNVTWQWKSADGQGSNCTGASCSFKAPSENGIYANGLARAISGGKRIAEKTYSITVGTGVPQPSEGSDGCGCNSAYGIIGNVAKAVNDPVGYALCRLSCYILGVISYFVQLALVFLQKASGL